MTAALASNIVAEPRHENEVDHKLAPDEDVDPKYVYKREIVWRNVAMMTMLHGLAFYGLFAFAFDPEKPWWGGLIVDAMGRLSAIGVTAGSHRFSLLLLNKMEPLNNKQSLAPIDFGLIAPTRPDFRFALC